jgi:hypothetical protein
MGGRSGSSQKATKQTYTPYRNGQISKMQAGIVYRNQKENNIRVLPETVRLFYNEADAPIQYASVRYSRDHLFYDRSTTMTTHLMNKDYKNAQKEIDKIEENLISRAGKKSPFYKYNKNRL